MKSKLGVGGAKFKLGGEAGPAETVYLGVFRREWLDRVGGYDPRFSRAQDWEMNSGSAAPGEWCGSPPGCASPTGPARTSGSWRASTTSTASGAASSPAPTPDRSTPATSPRRSRSPGSWSGAAGGFAWRPLWVLPLGYLALTAVGGTAISRGQAPAVRALVPPVLATMHLTWGFGFLTSRTRLSLDGQQTPSRARIS